MILDLPKAEQYHYADRRARKQRYRARRRGKPGTLTGTAWLKAIQWWGECCVYCGRHASEAGLMTLDHYRPLCAPDSLGTTRRNCLPACERCNHAKQEQEPERWILATFGPIEGPQIIARIHAYFDYWQAWHGNDCNADAS